MVSIIIPVYKVEKYLSKCIESILKQTYFDLELILVDDGSPDKCPEICDTYVNNPVSVSLLSDDRKPQIRFLGNRHSGSGNLYHKSFRM